MNKQRLTFMKLFSKNKELEDKIDRKNEKILKKKEKLNALKGKVKKLKAFSKCFKEVIDIQKKLTLKDLTSLVYIPKYGEKFCLMLTNLLVALTTIEIPTKRSSDAYTSYYISEVAPKLFEKMKNFKPDRFILSTSFPIEKLQFLKELKDYMTTSHKKKNLKTPVFGKSQKRLQDDILHATEELKSLNLALEWLIKVVKIAHVLNLESKDINDDKGYSFGFGKPSKEGLGLNGLFGDDSDSSESESDSSIGLGLFD